jgi:predicted ATPase
VTIVGEGGVGKTRLALTAASELVPDFANGAWFVPLASVMTPELEQPDSPPPDTAIGTLVATAVLNAFNLAPHEKATPMAQLVDYLRDKTILLVLDNFEHLMAATPFILQLWQNAPGLTLLLTSRERLNLQAEYTLRLAGLPTPQMVNDPNALAYDSLRLFTEREPGYALNNQNGCTTTPS